MTAATVRSGFNGSPVRMRALIATLGLASNLFVSSVAIAVDCGDSIESERVPCRCGDVVVGDTRLQPGDPVVTERCPADGLFVRVPPSSGSVIVDLNGQEIRGSGIGAGVRILHGGSEGAQIIGGVGSVPGVLSGFGEGVRSTRPDDLRLIFNVIVRESNDVGMVVRGNRAAIESVTAKDNRNEGLRIGGRSVDLVDVRSEGNGGHGVLDRARGGARDKTIPAEQGHDGRRQSETR